MRHHTATSPFAEASAREPELARAAAIAIRDVLQVKADESVLIITNPRHDVSRISQALYAAALDCGARPVLIYQEVKTQLDFAEPAVMAALEAQPAVVISLSAEKLGKDAKAAANPYRLGEKSWNSLLHYQLHGLKSCRSFWSPGTTVESFARTVPIDYALLRTRCDAVRKVLDAAVEVRITAPGGTDLRVGLRGRLAKVDDGDFGASGQGGNLPAGETFISPENGTANGRIVFDGSVSLHEGDVLIETPVACEVANGFVTDISGGREAELLAESIRRGEDDALRLEREGKLEAGMGEVYKRNARNIGELGIGLNPAARISGAMLEDEKAFRTCHFAIGQNYDDDAPALIHLDSLVREPTIVAVLDDGSLVTILERGNLLL